MELTTRTPSMSMAIAAAAKVRAIGIDARSTFIDREDAITALERAVVSGEHIILLGPPGTGKSSLIRFFAHASEQSFFRLLLNPDTQRDDLVGPIDPTKLAHGVWDRAWSGLATNRFVFLDEIGKASGQVVNMTLDAMEERLVTSAGRDREIPLHLLAGATNETLGDDQDAAWDRFIVRVKIMDITDSQSLIAMLQLSGAAPKSQPLSDAELEAMRTECARMAKVMSTQVKRTVVKLWGNIRNVSNLEVPATPRRWKKLMVVAAAQALLDGRDEIQQSDLLVAKDVLWSDLEEYDKIRAFVTDTVDTEAAEIRAKLQMVQELRKSADEATGLESKSRVNLRADKLLKDLATKAGRSEWDQMRQTLDEIKNRVLA